MKNVKKIMAILLSAVMAFGAAGCGSDAPVSGNLGTAAETTDASAQNEESIAEAAENEESVDEAAENEGSASVRGDAAAENAFVIWAWNDDFITLQNLLIEDHPELKDRIVFVNAGGSEMYQDKLDEVLADESNELYPDIMLLEVDYVQKYVESDVLLDVSKLGIKPDDLSNMYEYNVQLGSDDSGTVKALFWQATPGSFQVRADLAQKYLGTTDADELYEKYFSSYDKILETAETVYEASAGKTRLFSGYSELYRVFTNSSRKTGWYDNNDFICVDESMYEYMDIAKTMYEKNLSFNSSQWDSTWYANMDGDGETTEAAIAYCGCPWFTYFCLGEVWTGNTILVKTPVEFYWGGTGLAATKGCSDKELAALILKSCTCDTDFMIRVNHENGDYMNNKAVIEYLLSTEEEKNESNSEMMYGQQHLIEFYKDSADSINASTVTDIDQQVFDLFGAQVDAYAMGKKDKDTAIADFKASVHDTFAYLKAE